MSGSTGYSEDALSAAAEDLRERHGRFELLICCIGTLHGQGYGPEKRIDDLDRDDLLRYFEINSVTPALAFKQLLPLLPRDAPARAVFLSAKIGGIGDNRLGGWFGYRASKAALNMLIKTASVELARSHKQLCVALMHPGTTETPLSEPFTGGTPDDKLYSPETTSRRLLSVIGELTADDNGRFINWDGSDLPW